MRRWNGWGDTHVNNPLKASARAFLQKVLGVGRQWHLASLESVCAQVPPSRLPAHPLVTSAAQERLLHALGQSLPDWVAMRSGRIAAFPDGVAYPNTDQEVRELLRYAQSVGAKVIPYGGGTSVVGHINPVAGSAPVLTIDLNRLSRLEHYDPISRIASFGAGVKGPDLEAQLRARGAVLGHFPQSFELSTLGGWIATRSSGQQSLYYGRIERLFVGGTVETPQDTLHIPAIPASSAGIDLREMVLGSEGRLGIITRASVQTLPMPQAERFIGVFFPSWEQGREAARQLAQHKIPLSMVRLSNARETFTTLTMAGHERAIALLERYLALRGADDDKCLMILGATGTQALVKAALKLALEIAYEQSGVSLGRLLGSQWAKNRFHGAYLRNSLWEAGYAVDTLESSFVWSQSDAALKAIEQALHTASAPFGEPIHVFTHLSHLYPTGSSLYTTYVFRLSETPEQTLERWHAMKHAASLAVVQQGGTISHQHGVGLDHAPYLHHEKGRAGMAALGALLRHFDPDGMMNPAKLLA